jgi:predicted metalloprotease
MKTSGRWQALRIGGLITAIAIGAAACGSTASTSAGPQNGPTGQASPSTPTPTPTPTQSLPPGCHGGVAHDVASTLAILTDPSNCPGSVNAYWKSQLGSQWTDPVFIPYRDGEIPANKCGKASDDPEDFADNAFYCPADDTIAYSQDLLDSLYQEGGPYLPVVVLEHELGHRANRIADDVGVISRSEENQADCDAGVTTAYARTAHRLPFTDVIEAAKLLYKLGDTRNFGSEVADSPDAHGTPSQRVIAFGRGYFQKIGVCRVLGESETGSVEIAK